MAIAYLVQTGGTSIDAIIAISLAAAVVCGWVIVHTKPLDQGQVLDLAQQRRSKSVRCYFSFSRQPVEPNPEFKKRMAPDGKFYNIRHGLSGFPSLAAALMKYKKHEWMIVAMEKGQEVSLLWLNKGTDGTRVCLSIPFEQLASTAGANGFTSVLVFHNHPNTDPSRYSCSQPSLVDSCLSGCFSKPQPVV